ncbi:MAG: pyridoxamine 5'-phosphate oxidase family protein [Spirochaetes bacterium]|nr:MAG: pyridoxamine 5'-phosphate oxidase family protein [Spirochaetota bacterium]
MDLKEYFESHTGTGVLATADAQGNTDAALYSRPHFMEDGTIAFIMNDRLSHRNLQSNPRATYLFIQKGSPREGVRLYLARLREDGDPAVVETLRRHRKPDGDDADKKRFVVYFRIEKTRPLVDPGPGF